MIGLCYTARREIAALFLSPLILLFYSDILFAHKKNHLERWLRSFLSLLPYSSFLPKRFQKMLLHIVARESAACAFLRSASFL